MQQQPYLLKNPYDTYKTQGVMTASPVELIIMLYNALKKNLLLAKRAIEQKKEPEIAHNHLMKAQNIIDELLNSLDMSFSLSKDLMAIYEYMLHELVMINARKDAEAIDPLMEIIEELRNTWQQVGEMQKGSTATYANEGTV